MKKERLSNFDLLKIVSMLFIILGHILLHGNVLNNTIGTTNMLLTFIMLILMVHVIHLQYRYSSNSQTPTSWFL